MSAPPETSATPACSRKLAPRRCVSTPFLASSRYTGDSHASTSCPATRSSGIVTATCAPSATVKPPLPPIS